MRRQNAGRQIVLHAGLVLMGLFVVVPLWGLAYMAFDTSIHGWPLTFRLWPGQFSLDIFGQMWQRPGQDISFLGLLRNSFVVSGGAALLSVIFGASMAYAFARLRFPGKKAGLFVLLIGAFLPPVALMTPLFVLLSTLGIRTSLLGLVVVYTAIAMPFCIWNMRAAFQAVPREMEEAACLDGASFLTTFRYITLPLALPALAVAALVAFLVGYSEFAIGWLFVSQAENVTLAMAISGLMRQTITGVAAAWSELAALALMMSLPVVVLFLLLQPLLVRGLLFASPGEEADG